MCVLKYFLDAFFRRKEEQREKLHFKSNWNHKSCSFFFFAVKNHHREDFHLYYWKENISLREIRNAPSASKPLCGQGSVLGQKQHLIFIRTAQSNVSFCHRHQSYHDKPTILTSPSRFALGQPCDLIRETQGHPLIELWRFCSMQMCLKWNDWPSSVNVRWSR